MEKFFTSEVIEQLKYYVYRLIDPRNGQTFYVGKGQGNRVFAHLNCALKNYNGINYIKEKEEELRDFKYQTIRDIENAGLEVIHIIHRWNMDNKTAYEVEAAVMDCYPGLTNKVAGHGDDFGTNNVETLQKSLSLAEYEENDKTPSYIIIKTNMWKINELEGDYDKRLYDATRSAWRVNENKIRKYKYVFSVVNGIVKEVYEIDKWQFVESRRRYEFEGHKAYDIRENYINKKVPAKYRKKGMANPILYYK